MKKNYFSVVVILILVFLIIGLVVGQVPWGGLIGSIAGFSIMEITRNSKKFKEKEINISNDERVASNIKQFIIATFFIALSCLFIFLIIYKYVFSQDTVNINYVLLFIITTFFVTILGGNIVKQK